MSRTLAANVFITKSRRAIDKLFFGDNELTNLEDKLMLLDELEIEDSFVSSPNRNDGLVRFEYTFRDKSPYVSLRFLETTKTLEYVIMGNDPAARMLESKYQELRERGGRADVKDFQDGVDNLLQSPEDFGIFPKDNSISNALENLNKGSDFYFAFGVGNNLKEWSGPYSMKLTKASLYNDELNNRFIDVQLVPNNKSRRMWSKNFERIHGLGGLVDNLQNSYNSINSFIRTSASYPSDTQGPNQPIKDLDVRVRELLKRYISNISEGKNVVTVFPNRIQEAYDAITPKLEYEFSFVDALLFGIGADFQRFIAKRKYAEALKEFPKQNNSFLSSLGIMLKEGEYEFDTKTKNIQKIKHPDVQGDQTANTKVPSNHSLVMSVTIRLNPNADYTTYNTPLTPLSKFVTGLRSIRGEKYNSQEFTIYEESDMKILKMWKDHGVIEDDSKPAIVFGDAKYIADILYLDSYYNGKNNSKLPRVLEVIKDTFGFKFSKSNSVFPTIEVGLQSAGFALKYNQYVEQFSTTFNLNDVDNINSSFGEKTSSDKLSFRHNVKNSNVLELNYRVDNYIPALVGLDVQPNVTKNLSNNVSVEYTKDFILQLLGNDFLQRMISRVERDIGKPSEDITNNEFLLKALADTELENSLLREVAPALAEEKRLEELTTLNLVEFIAFIRLLDNSKKDSENTMHLVTEEDRYDSMYVSVLDKVKSLLFKVELKTLPFFKQKFYLNRSCEIAGINNGLVGDSNRKQRPAPYSGDYLITGWSHVIEPDNCYSTFSLVRRGYEEGKVVTSRKVKEAVIEYLQSEKSRLESKFEEELDKRIEVGRSVVLGTFDPKMMEGSLLNNSSSKELQEIQQLLERIDS